MKPILFESSEQNFKTQGLGVLSDTLECLVTEERNGKFEAEIQYPENGIHFSEIQSERIVLIKPSPYRLPQPFRIYRITKPLDGIVSIYARHITYDLNGIPLDPFTANNVSEAILGLKQHSAIASQFNFWTDKITAGNFQNDVPVATRAVLGGKRGSILDVYGGEYEWDFFTVKLHDKRGHDNGVVIRYGKNLTNIEQDENISNLYTGLYPYWKDDNGKLVTAEPKIIDAEGNFPFSKILPVDFSTDFDTAPTPQQIEGKGKAYIKSNKIGIPKVSIKVEFFPLEQTEEYKNVSLLERCDLCDIVTVQFPKLEINAKAKIVKGVYNALLNRWESIEVGEARTNIADTIIQQGNELAQKIPGLGEIQGMVDKIAGSILGAKGGAVRVLDTDGDGNLDTLYIADNEDPELAQKVWRFNYEGWGASKNGYNGPFTMAASIDYGLYGDFITAGQINASLITTGILNAAVIKAGILKSKDGISYWNLDSGELFLSGILQTQYQNTKAILKGGKLHLENENRNVGFIGTNHTTDGRKGLVCNLEGDFITWGVKEANGLYGNKLTYWRTGNSEPNLLKLGCNFDCNYWNLKNAKLNNLDSINGIRTVTGKIPIITDIQTTQSPYIQWWRSEIIVQDGIITSIPAPKMKVARVDDLPKLLKVSEGHYIERGDLATNVDTVEITTDTNEVKK